MHGYYTTGYLDKETRRYPVALKILSTCHSSIPCEVLDNVKANFPRLHKMMLEFGRIPDEVFKEMGFRPDIDANGKLVERTATISQESQQRCKCLTHEHQIMLRKNLLEEARVVIEKKAIAAQEKHVSRLNSLRIIVEKLLNGIPDGIFEARTLEYCDLSQFASLTSPELAEFIYAHDPKVLLKKDIHPHKGFLQDAINAVESGTALADCRIWQAYMCRTETCKVEFQQTEIGDDGAPNEGTPDEEESISRVHVLELLTQKEASVMPSHLLGDAQWLDYTNRLFGVENLVADILVNDEMKERGDMLAGMLRDRLKTSLRRRVQSEGKRKHWAFELASKNLSAVAAYMVLVDHVRHNLQFVDGVEHILTNDSNKFIPCSRFPLHSGGYLHYDKDAMKWVRSGKVGERGFAERNDDHEKNARKANHNSSNFYYSYLSKAILDHANFKSRLGVFESLEHWNNA